MKYDFDEPLYAAAANGDLATLTRLLDDGMDIDCGMGVDTALHGAAWHGEVAVVELLLERGASVDPCDERGRTPLFDAVRFYSPDRQPGKHAIVELLLDHGAQIDSRDEDGCTPFFFLARDLSSCKYNFSLERGLKNQTLKQLLARGAAVNVIATDGSTPLLYAVRYGMAYALIDLIHLGADLMQRDSAGLSPLRLALQQRRLMIFTLLALGGAHFLPDELLDPEALLADCILKQEPGLPADKTLPAPSLDWFLVLAARRGSPAMARFLIEAGADTNGAACPRVVAEQGDRPPDFNDGLTPFEAAMERGDQEMLSCLALRGALT